MSTIPERSPSPGTNVPGAADAAVVATGLPAGVSPESQPTIPMHASTTPHTAGRAMREVSLITLLSPAAASFADWTLRDYAGGGDLLTAASPVGTGPQQLPKYLLIYVTPGEVPWHIQYALNPVRCAGRLDLTEDALANYVAALLNNWKDAASSYASPVVWAVDHGGGDITALMRDTVAAPIYQALKEDPDGEMPSATFIDGTSRPLSSRAATA